MIAAWMLYSLAVGGVIAVAAGAADHCCRLLRLPRRWVWIAGVAAAVLLSGAGLARQAATRPAAPVTVGLIALDGPAATPPAGIMPRMVALVPGYARAVRAAAAAVLAEGYAKAAAAEARLASGRLLLLLWGGGSGALLLLLAVTLLRVRRARRWWREHRIAGEPVLLSEDFGPAVVGLLRPVVVVPAWLLREPEQSQQLIIQHEEEHRRARDPLALVATCAAVCLLPWNLVLWWLLARTRLAVELDCDARTLRRGATPLSYGSLLLEIAGRSPARLLGVPALTDSRMHLERRLLAMTERNRTPGRARPLLAGITALVLGAAACHTDVPTAAAIADMDARAAKEQAEQGGLLTTEVDGGAPLFVVDGKVVSEAEAQAIAPEDIAAIEVLRKEAADVYGEAGRNGVIRMMKKRSATSGELAATERTALLPLGVSGYVLQEPEVRTKVAPPAPASAAADVLYRIAVDQEPTSGIKIRRQEPAKAKAEQAKASATTIRKQAPAAAPVKGKAPTASTMQTPGLVSPDLKPPQTASLAALPEPGVLVRTRVPPSPSADREPTATDQLPMRRLNPFVVIDGDVAPSAVQLPTLSPDEILSVEVLKGEAAVKRYGARAANGAIVITTKKGKSR